MLNVDLPNVIIEDRIPDRKEDRNIPTEYFANIFNCAAVLAKRDIFSKRHLSQPIVLHLAFLFIYKLRRPNIWKMRLIVQSFVGRDVMAGWDQVMLPQVKQ